jgi:hypothetical protein
METKTDMDMESTKQWLDDYMTKHGVDTPEFGGFVCKNKSKEFLNEVSILLNKLSVKSRIEYNLYGPKDMYYLIIDYYECKGLNFIKTINNPKYEFYTQWHR